MSVVIPFPEQKRVRAVDVLIHEHEGKFYGDVDGYEVVADSLDQVLVLVTGRVRQVWPTDDVLLPRPR
jgi:hypothetical protein